MNWLKITIVIVMLLVCVGFLGGAVSDKEQPENKKVYAVVSVVFAVLAIMAAIKIP